MQDREPDEFRESTSFFQIWLLSAKIVWHYLVSTYFFILILVAIFPKLIMPYSESMEFVGEELMPPSWVEKGRIAFSLHGRSWPRCTQSINNGDTIHAWFIPFGGYRCGNYWGRTRYSRRACLTGLKRVFLGHFFDAFFIDSYFADCHYHFHVNGTKLNKCHVCYPISYFAVFCACHLSSDSTRAEERLCSLTKIRWDFKLGAIKKHNFAEY